MSRQLAKDYYNQVASEYEEARVGCFYYCERHAVLELLPEIANKTVLDVACGTGLYTRLFETLKATAVTGVDISSEMLQQARARQKPESVIHYIERDICEWEPDQDYDLAFSTYIFNYADSEQRLAEMIRSMAGSLKAGGKLVVIQDILGLRQASNFPEDFSHFQIYHSKPVQPFAQFRLTLKGSVCPASGIDIYPNHIEPGDLENQLLAHGFSDIRFIAPVFHQDLWQKVPSSDLRTMSCYPWFLIVTATRNTNIE